MCKGPEVKMWLGKVTASRRVCLGRVSKGQGSCEDV